MKTENARELIIAVLKESTTVTAQEINYASKGVIPFIQIYSILKTFILNGSVKLEEQDNKKLYTLIDESKLNDEVSVSPKTNSKVTVVKEEEQKKKDEPKKFGRDLTTYKFNGSEYNKGRLAHAIVSQYAIDKRPSLKQALEMFPDELVRPYGMICPIKEAKDISKERARFFIKPEEEVKLRDVNIAVSNQWTVERITQLIAIAKKQLGYKIR